MRSSLSTSLCQLFSLFECKYIHSILPERERELGNESFCVKSRVFCGLTQKAKLVLVMCVWQSRFSFASKITQWTNNIVENNMSEHVYHQSLFVPVPVSYLLCHSRKNENKMAFFFFARLHYCYCACYGIIYNQFRRRIHYRTQTLFTMEWK